ncbi:MspA family porin [Gordonia polyisoprenivorans]|uniref:MspA family porin n=1 Tax=Gordonia polyisoprenivorans TaxID=84595 RepID=UPI0022FFCAAC|nr:MspA family porin [Gordonia polyisoprenivorans]WCB38723.1 MspA family porin [Gordonia polyisoprenivorans]
MSKFSKLGLRRAAGACAITAAAAIGLASMGTGNAAAAPLPNGSKVVTGLDGEKVQTIRTGENAWPVPSLAANGAGRAAEVSGVYTVKSNDDVTGRVYVGFLIGCQINIDGLSGGISGGFSLPSSPSLSGSLSVPLTPGQVTTKVVDYKELGDKGIAAFQLDHFGIDVQQCGGFAQARSFVYVMAGKGFKVDTDNDVIDSEGGYIQSTLWGKPFSLN